MAPRFSHARLGKRPLSGAFPPRIALSIRKVERALKVVCDAEDKQLAWDAAERVLCEERDAVAREIRRLEAEYAANH